MYPLGKQRKLLNRGPCLFPSMQIISPQQFLVIVGDGSVEEISSSASLPTTMTALQRTMVDYTVKKYNLELSSCAGLWSDGAAIGVGELLRLSPSSGPSNYV